VYIAQKLKDKVTTTDRLCISVLSKLLTNA